MDTWQNLPGPISPVEDSSATNAAQDTLLPISSSRSLLGEELSSLDASASTPIPTSVSADVISTRAVQDFHHRLETLNKQEASFSF